MKKGFTLAEVLITLGIIGIVAAMTLPTLIGKYRKMQTVTQLKTNYTILNTAINRASAEYGTNINDWSIVGTEPYERSLYFVENYIIPYLKVVKSCKNASNKDAACTHTLTPLTPTSASKFEYTKSQGIASFVLSNGCIAGVRVWVDSRNNLERVNIYFDVNGIRKPNIQGIDGFMVEFGGAEHSKTYNKFLPYGYESTRDRSAYIGNTTEEGEDGNGCNNTRGNGNLCFALIMYDGWEIKDDYPWK